MFTLAINARIALHSTKFPYSFTNMLLPRSLVTPKFGVMKTKNMLASRKKNSGTIIPIA
jgi:hypothetical protein